MLGTAKFQSLSNSNKQIKNKSIFTTTARTPQSPKSNKFSKCSTFLEETRSHANSLIDDLIYAADQKRNDTASALKAVGSTNLNVIDSIKNDQFSFCSGPWEKKKTNHKRVNIKTPKNETFINRCFINTEEIQKEETIQSLKIQNARLRDQLNRNNHSGLWAELQELKRQNEMLRKDTIRYMMKK